MCCGSSGCTHDLWEDSYGYDAVTFYVCRNGRGSWTYNPFYLKFKGGKGIAATAGLIISTTNIWIVLICLAAFIAIVATTRYVSLGSMTVVTIYLISVIVYGQHGGFHVENVAYLHEMYGIATFLMILAFWRHRANIKRLLSGTENKISVGGKDKK